MSQIDSPTETPLQPMLRIPKSATPVPTPSARPSRGVPVLADVGIVLALVSVLVVGSQSIGGFKTTGQLASNTSERVAPAAGADTAEIKGWMTIQQVLDAYPVTKADLYAKIAIPADTPTDTTLTELKESGAMTLDIPMLRTWIGQGAPA
jgi:hypothetical protein